MLKIEPETGHLTDPVFGVYEAAMLQLTIPSGDKIYIQPIGRDSASGKLTEPVVGKDGRPGTSPVERQRVSMWSARASRTFYWTQAKQWEIWPDAEKEELGVVGAKVALVPLDRDSFVKAFLEVLGA